MILAELDDLVALRGAAHGLDLHARRPALAQLAGSHHSAHRGLGLEFEEVRPYAPGDDVRSIDWRVTARRGRAHTKLFREERERPVWLVADLHPGLFFGSRRQLKSTLLLRAAALCGWVAVGGGDRLGAAIGGAAPRLLRPRAREAGVLPVFDALVAAQPRAPGPPDPGGLNRLLGSLPGVVPPGSLILVLSDFAGLDADSEPLFAALAARHECWLLQVADPLEIDGLPAGRFRVGLPGRLWTLDGDRSRARWQAAWAAREQRLTTLARRFALPLTRLMTADAVETALPPLLRAPAWAA
ncbi:DUF58 domain-containing protein [Nitrogeniibacter mangrovi]|uniref:DUF58 domain-containing protein n=1 Tax=Nitrogeniibacter mangrovi TaxID=2016596 RepID=A0A6C1B1Z7_9RHOO|nr:DUF58 domain-containing protein [Nitrogeniibacter mangrovi]QID16925.1 DUF58 domain-containing protein [Nitrogeniibacter mangrovi]